MDLTKSEAEIYYQHENTSIALTNLTDIYNLTEDEIELLYRYEDETKIYRIYLELFTILALICIAANVLICYVIIKYKRLRKEKSNIILMNWTILNTLFMIVSPATLRLAIDFLVVVLSSTTYCFVEQLEYTFLLANILLMVLLTMYWYLKLYNETVFERYMRNFNFFVGSVYVFCLFCISLHWDACYNGRFYTLSEVFLMLCYLIFIVFMIIMNILHFVKHRRVVGNTSMRNVPFILTNTFFLSVLPSLLAFLAGIFIYLEPITIISILSLTLLISVMNPLYFFAILYYFDKDYNTFIRHVLSCKCKQYDNDELMEPPVVYNNETRYAENSC